MNIDYKINIEEEKVNKFKEIVKKDKKTENEIFNIIFNKIIQEDSVDWIYATLNGEVKSKNIKSKKAIELFKERGHKIYLYNTTYASKNKGNYLYWLNPDKRHIKEDWYIILNDNINKILYLMFVPKNSISELKMRNDKICDASIRYNDLDFLEIKSNIYFKDYLVDVLQYDSLIL